MEVLLGICVQREKNLDTVRSVEWMPPIENHVRVMIIVQDMNSLKVKTFQFIVTILWIVVS
jgi:hypothetical protein